MARRTADDFISNVAANIGDPNHDVMTANAILRMVNDAQNEITATYEPTEMLSYVSVNTTAGDSYIEFTYEYQPIKTISLFLTSTMFRLIQIDEPQYRMFTSGSGATGSSGVPTHYYEAYLVGLFRLWPTPDSVYQIGHTYLRTPTEIVSTPTPTSSALQQPWDEVIEMLATSKAFMRLQQFQAADIWLRQAVSLGERIARAAVKQSHEPLAIGNPKIGWFAV